MRHLLNIGVDLMGSENAPQDLLDSVISFSGSYLGSVQFTLFGTKASEKHFEKINPPSNTTFICVSQYIEMDENPLVAIRQKKDSSICVGMKFLKTNKIDAFVSSGNTGALVSAAKTLVGMRPKILRPALLAWIPTKKKTFAVLDVGANVYVKSIHLVQFAQMGIELLKDKGIAKPKVGLLNIGSEKLKGTTLLQETFAKLMSLQQSWGFHFVGNIEGKDVFQGAVDVLITDGFTGNIFLKTAEGIASLILDRLKEEIPQEDFHALTPHLDDLQSYLHYAKYPGAVLLGLKDLVIKCHGYSIPEAFVNGIKDAIGQLSEKLK